MDASESLAYTINQLVDVGDLRTQPYRPLHALSDAWAERRTGMTTTSVPAQKLYEYTPSWRACRTFTRERADMHDIVVFAAALLLNAARASSGANDSTNNNSDIVDSLVIYTPADWVADTVAHIEEVVRGSRLDDGDRTGLQRRAGNLFSFAINSTTHMRVLGASVRVEPNTHSMHSMHDASTRLAVHVGARAPAADKRLLAPLVFIQL